MQLASLSRSLQGQWQRLRQARPQALAGGRSPDQFLALLQSRTVADRMLDQFELQKLYDKELREDARRALSDAHLIAA